MSEESESARRGREILNGLKLSDAEYAFAISHQMLVLDTVMSMFAREKKDTPELRTVAMTALLAHTLVDLDEALRKLPGS